MCGFKVHCCLPLFAAWLHKSLLISVCVDSRLSKIVTSRNSDMNETRLNTVSSKPKEVYLPPLYIKLDITELSSWMMNKRRWIYVFEKYVFPDNYCQPKKAYLLDLK
jgi:hypothetical protein